MYVGGDCAQIRPQIWTQHEKRITFAFPQIFGKFWMRNLANRTADLESARGNDENRLFTCVFRSPDEKTRFSRQGALFRRPAVTARPRAAARVLWGVGGSTGEACTGRGTRGGSRLDSTVHGIVALVQ